MATVYRGVSGVVAAMILLLMFVGIVLVYQVYMGAQQRIYEAQREAAQLQAQMQAASRAITLYYTFNKTNTGSLSLLIYAQNMGANPVTISDLILEWGWQAARVAYNITVIGNNTSPGTPSFEDFAEIVHEHAGVEPALTIRVYYASGGNETLPGLPVVLGPGDKLEINISPIPADIQIYSVSLLIELSLPGVGTVAALVTPKVAGGVVYVATPATPPTGAVGTGVSPPPFDTVTWVYGIPLKIQCEYERINWPTAVLVNFTAAGISYKVDPAGVRLLDLDNNAWVPINVTEVKPNYMVIVFPLTCSKGQLRNFTIYAAGGPLAHPEGFYQVGLARLWNNTVILKNHMNLYTSPAGTLDYILLEAPIGTIEPLDETTLSNYEKDISTNVDNYVKLDPPIPYYSTSITTLYYHSDIRLNASTSSLFATPSISSLAQASPSMAPAWLAGWKYYIEINVSNPLGYTLNNVLVNISTSAFPSPAVVDNLFAHARPDGGDIIFVEMSTGRPLQFLTVRWDPGKREAEWLVKIPYLGPWQTIRIGLFYGNPAYNASLETFVNNPANLQYVYNFLSDIQPPSIHGYQWNYTYFILPINTWNRVLAATNYPQPNATLTYSLFSLFPRLYIELPSGFSFPFYGVTYNSNDWQYYYQNSVQWSQDPQVSMDVARMSSTFGLYVLSSVNINLYYNVSYRDALGAGMLIRASGSATYIGLFLINVYFNNSIIIYSSGVIRYIYGPVEVEGGISPPVRVGIANGTGATGGIFRVIVYSDKAITELSYHDDILFVPYAPLATVYWWHPAASIYFASLSASAVALPRAAGGGFYVFHWKSDSGIYGSSLDVVAWLAWDGDILVVPYLLPRIVSTPAGDYVINYTIGFAPGIADDPGVVLFSDADGYASVYNFSRDSTIVMPVKEVLLLRYNGSYTVYMGKAAPMFPWVVGWLHGLRVIIHNPLDAPLVNYTVHVVLGADNLTSDYISSASNPLFGKDIRVLDEEGNRIPFWVYYYDASVPVIKMWVKVPEIPANGNAVIYIYYAAQPPPGVSVKNESDPNATMTFYFEASGGCPPMRVYNTTSYECVPTVQPGYPVLTTIVANLTPGDIVRFYSDVIFGLSALYGYEYRVIVTPDTAAVDYDVVVELVPYGYEEGPPTTASYGVFFGHGVLGRLIGGSVDTTWDQGSVAYTPGSMYTIVIRINGSKMVTLVYNSSGLVASAVDSINLSGYLHAALTSYAVSVSGQVMYAPVEGWVRPWVYREPYVASSVLLS